MIEIYFCRGIHWAGFVVAVQVAEFAPGLHKRREIFVTRDKRDARQSLLKVVLVFLAIRRAMQDAIDIIENVFFCYLTPLPPEVSLFW